MFTHTTHLHPSRSKSTLALRAHRPAPEPLSCCSLKRANGMSVHALASVLTVSSDGAPSATTLSQNAPRRCTLQ